MKKNSNKIGVGAGVSKAVKYAAKKSTASKVASGARTAVGMVAPKKVDRVKKMAKKK